ncbi:hypothetical protein M378DRAFT_158350 [Amanita muscaria Koide BX008]|uniref:Sterol regulatory element-binding protein cleavage-activating protein n=1 Tax=Amanita muscaria (strain Koide BX008) TaxID=946122 RepID=A0A0C2XHW8_AMAMK|nr:hypothetical protein M378DRAFT_158350 [Amanita muscaria Koide BX008]
MLSILHWFRSFAQTCFLRFGLHCATHQIRVILISCVVITSLFYPALALYSSSQPLSLSLIDVFVARNSASDFHAYNDLGDLWSGYDALKVHQDAVSRVKCGAARALRVERLLIRNHVMDDTSAVNRHLILFTLALEKRLNDSLLAGHHPCLKREDGQCFVISPTLFWKDRDAILADANVVKTLNTSHNVMIDGITITPKMVLAGRASSGHRVGTSSFDFAAFLALTYFFPESDCLSTLEHSSWKQTVQDALANEADVRFQPQEPSLIALEYDPGHSHNMTGTGLATFVNLAYICFFVYVVWSVRRMDAVHSRLGVTFTALVEITVSTITSLSVCALVGFKITMVPWELLPIVIVFVGAENMFNLVDAVGRTSVTLTVKQRVAEGLSRAGTSNTLKVVTYNTILGLIAAFSGGAVRQFCVFATVVLVAHWFLAHTFFITVLSIDIQRLELEELLQHDPTVVTRAHKKPEAPESLPSNRWRRLMSSTQALLRGRAVTNISLLMLLAITATLYYMTYFSSLSVHDAQPHNPSSSAMPWVKSPALAIPAKYTTAWNIWRNLNPTQRPLLHLRIEMPATVALLPNLDLPNRPQRVKSLSIRSHFHLIFWLLKIMVLPIAGTTSMLWFLLLHLLKDAELLEAQRNRDGPDSTHLDSGSNEFEARVSFSPLPRGFSSDIELIASSKDGQIVASVGLNNELMVWFARQTSLLTIDVEEVLTTIKVSSAQVTITSITLDEFGEYLAVGTKSGDIAVWNLGHGTVQLLHLLRLDKTTAGIADLRCLYATPIALEKPTSPDSTHSTRTIIMARLDNGSVIKWTIDDDPIWSYVLPAHTASVSKALLCSVDPDDTLLVAFVFDDGCVELVDGQKGEAFLGPRCCFQVGGTDDMITEIYICRLKLRGNTRSVMAVTTESGKVSLWDVNSQDQLCEIGCNSKPRQPRIIQGQRETCQSCGSLPLENFSLVFAVEEDIKFYRLLLYDQVRYCTCSSKLQQRSSYENINRSTRGDTTALQSSEAPRSRGLSSLEKTSFPVSGHGIYPRRPSEGTRRSSEILMVPFPGEDHESIHIPGANVSKSHVQRTSNPPLRNYSLVHLMDVPCGKGKWELASRKIIGVRRKERLKQKMANASAGQRPSACGLPISTLDRWELWTFDFTTLHFQATILSAILCKEVIEPPSQRLHIPRMPFTRVSSFVVTSIYALAGFGNTIGLFTFSNA